MSELDRIELSFKQDRETTRTVLFQEVFGEQEWSSKGTAVGSMYIMKEVLELIGNPKRIKVIIEPEEGGE